ncbi:MAG: hypothetical protein P8014_20285, partial [Acidihalobacter sp.]|uniref:hypothetical protein n=1 Tax=Acidihalobacter sp. TaxID=1872108 RepID=UPI00307D400D
MTAGYAAAFATFVGAVQAAVNAYSSNRHGDDAAATVEIIQSFFLLTASVALFSATSVAAGFEVAGISALSASAWTGIGLIFVGLGMLMAYVILLVKDKPPEVWAARCIWGNASQSEKYPTLQHEVAGLNEMIMGAEVDFAYNSGGTFWSDALVNVSASQRNWGESAAGRPLTPQTHEAWLRLVLPKELKPRIGWLLQ